MKKILFLIGSIFLLFALASCDEDSTFTFPTDFTETTTDSSTTGDTSGTTEITTTTDGTTIDTTTTGGTTTTEETTTTEDTTSTEDTTTTTTEETTAEVTTVIEEQLSSPTNLAITDQSLTWDAVGDATAYQVFKDGVFLAEVTTTEYDFSALTGDTIDFAVKAIAPTGMQDSPMSLTLTYMANSTNEISSMLLFMQNSDMNISSDQEEFVTELVNRGMTTTQMQAMMTNVEPLMSAMQTATTLGGFYTELDTLMDSATNIEALISALIRVELPAILAADLEYYQTNDGTCDDYDEYSDTCYYYHDFTDDIQNTQNMLYFLENHPDEAVQSVMVVVNYLMRVQDNITTDWVSDLDTLLATPSPDAMDITLAVSVKNGLVNNLYTELPTLEEFTLFNQTMLSFASIMLEDNTMETYVKAHKLSQQMHFSFRFVFDYLLMIDYDYIDGMLAAMVQADKLSAAEDILVLQLDYLNTFLDNNQDKFTDFNAIYTDAEKEAFFFDVIVTQILNANMYSPGTPEFDEVMLIIESNVEFTDLLALQSFSSAQFNALLDRLSETDYAMIHDAFALARIEQNFETYTTYDEYVTARQAAQFDLVDSLLITINPIIQNMTNEEKTMVLENILSFAVVGLELELDHYQAKDGTCAWYDELADECYETYDFTEDIQNLENMLYFLENNSDDAIQSVIIVLDYFGAIQNDISSTWLTDLETLMQTPSPDQLDVLLAISVKNELITNLKTELPTITDFTLFNETMLTLASVMLEDDTFQTDIAADKLAQQMHISLELFYDYLLMIDADYVNGMFSAMANEDQLLMNKEILILQLEYLDMFLTDNQVKLDDLNAIYTDIEKETFFYDILITQLINAQGYSPGTTEFNELMLIFEDDIDFTNLLALQDLASDNMNALLDQLLLTDFALIHDIFDMIEIEQSYYDYLDPEDFYYDISIAQFELMDSLVTTLNPIIQDMTAAEYTVLIENITSIITLIAEVEDYEYGNPDLSAIYLMMASLEDTSPDQLALIQALFAEVDSSGLIDSLKALYIEGLDSANPDLQTYGLILEIANVYINVYTDAGTNMDAIVTEFLALLNTTEVQTALGITQADVDELALLLDGYLQAVYDQAMIIKDYDYNTLTTAQMEEIEEFSIMADTLINNEILNPTPTLPTEDIEGYSDFESIPRYTGSILFDAFDSEYDQMRAYVVEASGEVVYNYYLNYFSTSMEWTISDNEYVALDDTYYINLTYTDAAYFVNIIIEPSFDYENATEIYIFLIPGESNTGGDFPTGDLVTLDDIGYAPRYDGSFLIDGYDEGDYKYRVYVSQDNPQLIYDMYYGYYNGDSTWSINDYGYDSESEIGYLSMSNNVDLSNIVIYIEPSYEYTDAWDIEIQYILYTNTTGDFPLEDTVTFADISVAPRYPGSVLIEGDDSEYLGEYSSYRVYLSQDDFESIYNMYYNLYDSDSTWTIDYSYSDPVYGEGYLILENTGDMSTIYIDIYPSYDYADTWEIVIDYLY